MSKYKVGDIVVSVVTSNAAGSVDLKEGNLYKVIAVVNGTYFQVEDMKGRYAGGWRADLFELATLNLENE